MFELERFTQAQLRYGMYDCALEEIKQGWKRSHWIWFIFPQMSGLGESEMSRKYSIDSLLEAKAYWDNDTLRTHLEEISRALLEHRGEPMEDILGRTDAIKVRSCMTLFDYVDPEGIYQEVLRECFGGEYCKQTRKRMDRELAWISRSALEQHSIKADDKAFMENFSSEAEAYTEEQILGTLIALFRLGERMEQMVSHYLWTRDTSSYRTSGVESSIKSYLNSILQMAYSSTDNPEVKKALDHYLDMASNADGLLYVAHTFDSILYEITKNIHLEEMLSSLEQHSLSRK